MTKYTKKENLANACIQICVMAQDVGISKKDFIEAISHSYDEYEKMENKEEFIKFLRIRALNKVFGNE